MALQLFCVLLTSSFATGASLAWQYVADISISTLYCKMTNSQHHTLSIRIHHTVIPYTGYMLIVLRNINPPVCWNKEAENLACAQLNCRIYSAELASKGFQVPPQRYAPPSDLS